MGQQIKFIASSIYNFIRFTNILLFEQCLEEEYLNRDKKPTQVINMMPTPSLPNNHIPLQTPQKYTVPNKSHSFAASSWNRVSAHIKGNANLHTGPTNSNEIT